VGSLFSPLQSGGGGGGRLNSTIHRSDNCRGDLDDGGNHDSRFLPAGGKNRAVVASSRLLTEQNRNSKTDPTAAPPQQLMHFSPMSSSSTSVGGGSSRRGVMQLYPSHTSLRSLSSSKSSQLPMASPIVSYTALRAREQPQPTLRSTMMQHEAGYSWVVTTTNSTQSTASSRRSDGSSTSAASQRIIHDVASHSDSARHPQSSHRTDATSHHQVSEATRTNKSALLDRSYQKNKMRSQQRIKEELIMAALERLQDDLPLVQEVEGLLLCSGNHVSMFDWYVPTPLDQEGILTGFVEANRYVLVERLEEMLESLEEERKQRSTNSSADDDRRDDLRHALKFCKVLLQMAIPAVEKDDGTLQGTDEVGKWRFIQELRPVIGLLSSATPITPPARGGDSSFFSLPHDEDDDNDDHPGTCATPMTSNVSIGASTLTTLVHNYHNSAIPTTAHNDGKQGLRTIQEQNGLHLRQAIQLLCTGLQKLTLASLPLLQEPVTVSSITADSIKLAYFSILTALSQSDLKSIVDAFEFEQDDILDEEGTELLRVVDSDDSPGVEHQRNNEMPLFTSPIVRAASMCLGTVSPTDVVEHLDAVSIKATTAEAAHENSSRNTERNRNTTNSTSMTNESPTPLHNMPRDKEMASGVIGIPHIFRETRWDEAQDIGSCRSWQSSHSVASSARSLYLEPIERVEL
jgi:hypothetical protein